MIAGSLSALSANADQSLSELVGQSKQLDLQTATSRRLSGMAPTAPYLMLIYQVVKGILINSQRIKNA